MCFTAASIRPVVFSYTGAGVVGQCAIVGQGDVFLLPLLVQRAAASLPKDALSKTTTGGHCTRNKPPLGVSLNLESRAFLQSVMGSDNNS